MGLQPEEDDEVVCIDRRPILDGITRQRRGDVTVICFLYELIEHLHHYDKE
jgi:hypothetical protein